MDSPVPLSVPGKCQAFDCEHLSESQFQATEKMFEEDGSSTSLKNREMLRCWEGPREGKQAGVVVAVSRGLDKSTFHLA